MHSNDSDESEATDGKGQCIVQKMVFQQRSDVGSWLSREQLDWILGHT